LKCPEGIKENEPLLCCYKGIGEDLKALKLEGWVREIKVKKEIVLFPID
jgi:hypothetical protein